MGRPARPGASILVTVGRGTDRHYSETGTIGLVAGAGHNDARLIAAVMKASRHYGQEANSMPLCPLVRDLRPIPAAVEGVGGSV